MIMRPDTLPDLSAKKKRHITAKTSKGFKKDFDSPFKLMITDWWLQGHSNAKTLDDAKWLEGFCSRLKENDLNLLNKGYLEELLAWHKEKTGSAAAKENSGSAVAGKNLESAVAEER